MTFYLIFENRLPYNEIAYARPLSIVLVFVSVFVREASVDCSPNYNNEGGSLTFSAYCSDSDGAQCGSDKNSYYYIYS